VQKLRDLKILITTFDINSSIFLSFVWKRRHIRLIQRKNPEIPPQRSIRTDQGIGSVFHPGVITACPIILLQRLKVLPAQLQNRHLLQHLLRILRGAEHPERGVE
jgi:hypothetical protein